MLILFFGVSGVGKNTLIDELTSRFGWRYITTYMTRPLRNKREMGKISISQEQFLEMEKQGKFVTVNNLHGNLYGTPIDEVIEAVRNDNSRWVLDFPLSRRHLFEYYPHIGVVILPESIHQLIGQIQSSERAERLAEALDDYAQHYSPYQEQIVDEPRTFVVINFSGKKEEVATLINKLLEGKK